MAQQAEVRQEKLSNAKGALVQCTRCAHIWLARSTMSVLTCSACSNHIVARDNIVTTDALNQIKKVGAQPQ